MRVAAVMRPEGLAPKGQESLAQGLPWVSRNKRFALNGPDKRNVPASKILGRLAIFVAPSASGLIGGAELPRVKPGLCFLGHFGPQIGDVQTPSGLMTG
jgi:hypothetical protein